MTSVTSRHQPIFNVQSGHARKLAKIVGVEHELHHLPQSRASLVAGWLRSRPQPSGVSAITLRSTSPSMGRCGCRNAVSASWIKTVRVLRWRLHSRSGDGRFARVAVLRDQVAGEAGKVEILNVLNRPFTAGDRFAGAGKVMPGGIARLLTGHHGALDRVFKPAPLAVIEQGLQIARVMHAAMSIENRPETLGGEAGVSVRKRTACGAIGACKRLCTLQGSHSSAYFRGKFR